MINRLSVGFAEKGLSVIDVTDTQNVDPKIYPQICVLKAQE
jgi:hypothetical protein